MAVAGRVGLSGPFLAVVWADPGVATGWSVHRVPIRDLISRGQVGSTAVTWWRVGQFRSTSTSAAVDSYLSICRAVWERSAAEDVVVIGTEGFTLMMQSTDPALLEPVRFNAVLLDRLRNTDVRVEVQQPDQRTVITDVRLQAWGLWVSGMEHGRQAQKHGLVFLRRWATQPAIRERYRVALESSSVG